MTKGKLVQRFTCTRCGYSYDLPHGEFAGMNAETDCDKCKSIAFGLVRRELIKMHHYKVVFMGRVKGADGNMYPVQLALHCKPSQLFTIIYDNWEHVRLVGKTNEFEFGIWQDDVRLTQEEIDKLRLQTVW